jgi:hypothetical protein
VTAYLYHGLPEGLHNWGLDSTAKYFLKRLDVNFVSVGTPEAERLQRSGSAAIFKWDFYHRKLEIHTP